MKKLLLRNFFSLFFVAYSASALVYSQGQANNWYFGLNAGLTFNTNPPSALLNGALSTSEGSAVMSDAAGNLLFYTDGILVYDRNHTTMPNGNGLLGNPSSAQSAIIIPKPGSTTNYYIFTVPENGAIGMCYSEVDITLNGGMGDVLTTNKNTLLFTPSSEKVTAVKHANDLFYWVIGKENATSTTYRAFLVDCNGVNPTAVVSNGVVAGGNWGYLVASPNGNKLAAATSGSGVELADFNTSTGVVSNAQNLGNLNYGGYPTGNYGVAFSPNGNVLYASSITDWSLAQWDITATNIPASQTFIANLNGAGATRPSYRGGALQLGPDGKIYIAQVSTPFLGVINNPDVLGLGCNYAADAVNLGGRNSILGLPPFIQSFFNAGNFSFLSTNHCLGSATNFSVSGANFLDSLHWNFDDINSGTANFSNLINPSHTFTATGTYNVRLIRFLACVRDTVYRNVVIPPTATSTLQLTLCQNSSYTSPGGTVITQSGIFYDTIPNYLGCDSIITLNIAQSTSILNAGNDTAICLGASATLNASNALSYTWQANPTLSATNIANPIATPTQTTTYYLNSNIRIGNNLVTNGDFEQGNTGFSSAYHYFAPAGLGFNQGDIKVTNNPNLHNTGFSTCGDHTSGSGNFLLVDGACGTNGVASGTQFWCQTIPVTPNTDYAFSAWLTNVANNSVSSTLNFSINGNSIGTPAATNTTACVWSEFYVIWNSGAATSANICIAEGTGVCSGNDFAVDDISFYQICQVADSVTVQVSNPSVTVTDSTLVNCFGGNDGRIVTAVTNGITPYSYSWTNTSQTTSTIQQLTANTYVVTITDSIGCTATRSVTISQPADIVLTNEDIAVAGCYGAADGSATFSAVGGVHPYTWLWSNGENDSIANLLNPGTHTVTITDDHNCSKTASVTIQGEASPVAQFAGQNTCLNTLSQFMNQSSIAAPNTIAASNWTVFNNGSSTPSTNTNFQETLADSGSYTVQLIVTGSNGCADTVTQTHVVYPNPESDFTYQSICYQVNQFSDSSINYTSQNLSYFWDIDGNGQMDYYTKTFTHTYPTASPQMVTLRVEDANGCYDTITKQVYVTQNSDTLQVPNILVLSSMQNNDKLDFEAFAPDFNQCISYSLFIYNRWGNLVFETKNDKNNPDTSCNHCFTGKTQGGATLSAGTYFYVIQGEKEIIRKGSITIFD